MSWRAHCRDRLNPGLVTAEEPTDITTPYASDWTGPSRIGDSAGTRLRSEVEALKR
jgi:hypothetical protein